MWVAVDRRRWVQAADEASRPARNNLLCWALCRCVALRANLATECVKALMAVDNEAVMK